MRSQIFHAVAVAGVALLAAGGCSMFRGHQAQAAYPSASVAPTASAQPSTLTKQLNAELQSAPSQYGKVRAQVRGDTAYLYGHVKTAKERADAQQMAAALAGVSRVYNNIQVGPYTFQD